MTRYIARRLVEVAIALFAISTLVFIILHLTPGGPCDISFVPQNGSGQPQSVVNAASPATVSCADYYQLDRPVVSQYLTFLGNYLHGNLGSSLAEGGNSVGSVIAEHLPSTVLLVVLAFILQQVIALPLGIFAAVRRYSLFDGVFSALSYVALSTPAFVLGFALIYLFAVDLQMLPAGHTTDVSLPIFGTGAWFGMLWQHPALLLGDLAQHLLLPATTLAVVGIAVDSRFMRASMMLVLEQEYIRTARAKGVGRRAIILKHAVRNALPPIITNIGLYLPALVGSAMVVEWVFSFDGIGYTFTQAIESGNTTVEQAIFLLSTAAVLLGNLAADVAYGLADPRVDYR